MGTMNVKQKLIADGFDCIVRGLPFNFNYEDERVLRNPLSLKKMSKSLNGEEDLIRLYNKLLKYSPTVLMGRLYRDLFKTFKERLISEGLKDSYGEIPIYVLTFGDKVASRVATILRKNNIHKLKDMAYVSILDCERLGLHEYSRDHLRRALQPWDYDNLLGGL